MDILADESVLPSSYGREIFVKEAMSEFKYACPVCGQHIRSDSSQTGTVVECPTCFQKITVPQAPATGDAKFIIRGSKAEDRPAPRAPAGPGAATAPAKRSPLAAIALGIVLCAAGAAIFVFRGSIFRSAPTGTDAVSSNHVFGSASIPAPSNSTTTVFGYRLDPDQVVFVFEPGRFGVQVASNATVHVAGNFNQWLGASEGRIHILAPGWQMQRVADNRYELRKKLADFQQRQQWEFKFVVNLTQWVEVPSNALNRSTGEPVNLTLTIPERPSTGVSPSH